MARLLLVEDNELNRDMLQRRLERRGFAVALAADGAQGLAKARLELPDLILLDMNLPEVDGWEIARILKHDPLTCHIPVIALTADAMPADRVRAQDAGCDEYHTKPVDLEELLAKIHGFGVRASLEEAGSRR